MTARHMLALGRFPEEERGRIAAAAEQAALTLHMAETREEASRFLDHHGACALVLETGDTAQSEVAIEARAQAQHARTPILALTGDIGDLSFEEAFSWGADDVVDHRKLRGLISRLRMIAQSKLAPIGENRGGAIVAEQDRNRRVLLGRVLRNAGYDVQFAVTIEDAKRFINDDVSLVILDAGLDSDPRATIEAASTGEKAVTWIVTCPPKQLKDIRQRLAELERVCATDGYAPPENVLFLSNELESAGLQTRRRSPRILYGTTVGFRDAGQAEDDHGFTYNISEAGLFVRTTAPPSGSTVWLELCPPRSNARVRLEGEVAWRRPFGPSDHATVPPGFGVRIVDGTKRDLQAWQEGYEALKQILG